MLRNNIFNFIRQSFKQLLGTAMGATFASFYACLTIGYLEETKLLPELLMKFNETIVSNIIEAYKRFMDDGIVLLPWEVCENDFLGCLNALDEHITFTLENSTSLVYYGRNVECLHFLDILIILHEEGAIETDIFYKSTNAHDYLHYDSFHPPHVIKNIPYNLAKRIIVFVTNEDQMKLRLNQLRAWLLKCEYPSRMIDKGFHDAQLQGPAPPTTNKGDIVTYVHPYMSNFSFNHVIKAAQDFLKNTKDDTLRNIFSNTRFVEAISQPKNIIRLTTSTKFTDNRYFQTQNEKPGLYAECADKRCNLCQEGYIQQCTSFVTSNKVTWKIKSHINCNTRNVLYFLVCNMCKTENPVSKTGKTWTRFRERLNNHISDSFTGRTSDQFDLHVHDCGTTNKCLKPPYFKVYAYMKLSSPDQLLTYENYLHKKRFDTLNK